VRTDQESRSDEYRVTASVIAMDLTTLRKSMAGIPPECAVKPVRWFCESPEPWGRVPQILRVAAQENRMETR